MTKSQKIEKKYRSKLSHDALSSDGIEQVSNNSYLKYQNLSFPSSIAEKINQRLLEGKQLVIEIQGFRRGLDSSEEMNRKLELNVSLLQESLRISRLQISNLQAEYSILSKAKNQSKTDSALILSKQQLQDLKQNNKLLTIEYDKEINKVLTSFERETVTLRTAKLNTTAEMVIYHQSSVRVPQRRIPRTT